ncbi:MAG: efflux RND transporter periplasmic adaptor subunit [Gammaproteobacteria bacterium]|nr:efflux RND transporter periplasmic adaptor subunit [Gammaproteobacteria bacterium]
MTATDAAAANSSSQPAGALHEAILQTLASAVISIRPDGVITTFNAAAAAITGLSPAAVVKRTFAEVFLAIEDAEDFAQAVLDAVYKGPLVRQRVVEADFGGGARALSMSVSRIAGEEEADAGVAVVFEDITEIRELRAKELALAQEIEAQHKELRDAYLRLEERNRTLAEANRQTRLARIVGLGAVVVVLTVAGLYALDLRPQAGDDAVAEREPPPGDEATVLTVAPQELTRTITLAGQLAPRREVDVTSPISGKIAAVHVHYGARVEQGQVLVELDPSDVRIDHRDAQASHIKAVERLAEVENWTDGVEASRARRSVAKARLDLEDSRTRLEETAFLLERGVIPSSEHTAAQRGFTSRQLDLEAAEHDLASVMQKGAAEIRVAKLELENARARLDELTETLRLSVLKAPVAGVVMRPPATESGPGGGARDGRLAGGDAVTQGERLMIVGDLEGLAVDGRIDEVDIVNVAVGNEVMVSGDAFPGTVLRGALERVSSEATVAPRSLPFFEVTAVVPSLTPSQRAAVRIGMSAVLEVVVRQEAEAVLVPLAAIALVDGRPTVRVVGDDGPVPVPVVVGETTVGQIEILEGVTPGDRILVTER